MHSIDTSDAFFDSLRQAYNGNANEFDAWIDKCKKKQRRAWVIYGEEDKIAGLCIYNLDNEYSNKVFEMGSKALKLCTFKVSEQYRGMKLGELLLKNAFLYSHENKITSLWLTAFGNAQVHLIHFLKDFGFVSASFLNIRGEEILYKSFYPPKEMPALSPVDFHKQYSPCFYDSQEISKYIVPIIPEYHELLFPELVSRESTQLTLFPELSDAKIPGNTIRKVYLCHSPTKNLASGSIMFFYRSRDQQVITTIGIVEKTHLISDFSTLIRTIGKRSVYSLEEMREMLLKETMVIEFRFVKHLKTRVSYQELLENEVLNGPPISITAIVEEKYKVLKKMLE